METTRSRLVLRAGRQLPTGHASLVRRQRRRRAGTTPGGHGSAWVGTLAAATVLGIALAVGGTLAFTVSVAVYGSIAAGLPEPANALEAIPFEQQSSIYDRSGKVLLARLGSDRRTLVTFGEIPAELVVATTAIEDTTFWENPGFDPFGIVSAVVDGIDGKQRGASTVTMQLVRTRLLPAPAADISLFDRKAMEIVQSVRLTDAYPGIDGKRQIMAAYLNNNFYGNRTYGVAAAARGYWNRDLDQLTLAQMALLAAIPQSPSRYDLMAAAKEETRTADNGREVTELVVPQTAEVVQRRNFILQLMKTRSVLSGSHHTPAEYDQAMFEPVVLTPPPALEWRAPHFVWQVRSQLAKILCDGDATDCPQLTTGGYRVTTTLDYRMQRIVEKWLYAAAIIPNRKHPASVLRARKIPHREWSWILALRGHNIHYAAGAVIDYRTGEVLAYGGSASYTAGRSRRFQPKFDVLEDGWRQPGSSINPLGYLVGIDDRRMTAATVFMDVVTNFAPRGTKAWYPTQADHLERGPVRLRQALQFSLNIPAIKAGILNGVRHQLRRTKDFGLRYPPGTQPVISESIGTLTVHPIDMISAYGMIANGGVLMPRRTILEIHGPDGEQIWPTPGTTPKGERVASREAAYIITDILAGNTNRRINPFWGKWQITDGVTGHRVRPAAYKTGTTQDNRDVHAYGYLAPPADKSLHALVAGVWLGNSDNSPNDGKLSLDTSAPLWSAILSDVSKGQPMARFGRVRPKTLVSARVDPFTGARAAPGSSRGVSELFIRGTVPGSRTRSAITRTVDAATGLLWRDGCLGPPVTRTYSGFASTEADHPSWLRADMGWLARAARGPGVAGGPKGTRTAYFYGGGFFPFGRSWGGFGFPPSRSCPIGGPTQPGPEKPSQPEGSPKPSPSG
jgi:membrane peptidoglycan carboxypeptidase